MESQKMTTIQLDKIERQQIQWNTGAFDFMVIFLLDWLPNQDL